MKTKVGEVKVISATHALYAKDVSEHILLVYGVKLKRYSLIYGTIEPDFSSTFKRKYPHYLKDSLDEISDRLDVIVESLDTKRELETVAFSRELGVILHYIADYFCRVHNDIGGVPHPRRSKHLRYERNFHKFVKRCHLEVLRETVMKELEYDLKEIERMSFKDYVIYQHNKYMKEASKRSISQSKRMIKETDVVYSYEMQLLIASYVVWKVMNKTKLLNK